MSVSWDAQHVLDVKYVLDVKIVLLVFSTGKTSSTGLTGSTGSHVCTYVFMSSTGIVISLKVYMSIS